eukprot:CAMPEP_0119048116 /NCGR_PEP_ID=MMETSP1177-20130426/57037_1 /TAXON_ID=2985 /ORGANISM="Ochromonas sp, Strain CCMP1899" /LENGTH=612 /DNA_ID=CAMNT_0007023573 /DNA_START=89 /DNA_END=1927 /DNA_ORIENTATION=+
MPACKHGNMCKIKNCPLKHSDELERVECIFYKQGFCYNGPNCVRRHVKRSPDECPLEASFDQALSAVGLAAAGPAGAAALLAQKKRKASQPNDNYKVSLCNHWLLDGVCHFNDDCHFAHGEEEINEGFQGNDSTNDVDVYDPTRNRLDAALVLPYSLGAVRLAYFVFQAPDLKSLSVSKRRGVWSIPTRLADEVNAALRAHDNVIIYFLVRALKGMYGVCRMGGPIPPGPTMGMTPEFPIVWMRTQRIGMKTMAQMKVGSTGMFVGRTSTDCRFENKVGSEMLHIAYRKPEWDWDQEVTSGEQSIIRTAEDKPPPHSDALFSMDWIEKSLSLPKFGGLGGGDQKFPQFEAPKDFYNLDHPGFIFAAPPPVIEEMFKKSLFGLPAIMKSAAVHAGAPLFIFDEQARVVLGIFQSSSPISDNIDTTAFQGQLPVQLRFSIVLEAPPLHIQDPEFITIFPAGPTFGPIGLRETKLLANIFATRTGAMPQAVAPMAIPKGSVGGAAGGGSYRPPFKNVDIVYIDIKASLFEVKKRVLGVNASAVLAISNEVGGQNRAVRIRMRGLGSGYVEGPSQQELPEPLHFNVCAESEEILVRAVARVHELVNRAKLELEGHL